MRSKAHEQTFDYASIYSALFFILNKNPAFSLEKGWIDSNSSVKHSNSLVF